MLNGIEVIVFEKDGKKSIIVAIISLSLLDRMNFKKSAIFMRVFKRHNLDINFGKLSDISHIHLEVLSTTSFNIPIYTLK